MKPINKMAALGINYDSPDAIRQAKRTRKPKCSWKPVVTNTLSPVSLQELLDRDTMNSSNEGRGFKRGFKPLAKKKAKTKKRLPSRKTKKNIWNQFS